MSGFEALIPIIIPIAKDAIKKAMDMLNKKSKYNQKKYFEGLQEIIGAINKIYTQYYVYAFPKRPLKPRTESEFERDKEKINEAEREVTKLRAVLRKVADSPHLYAAHPDLNEVITAKINPGFQKVKNENEVIIFNRFESFKEHVNFAYEETKGILNHINDIIKELEKSNQN